MITCEDVYANHRREEVNTSFIKDNNTSPQTPLALVYLHQLPTFHPHLLPLYSLYMHTTDHSHLQHQSALLQIPASLRHASSGLRPLPWTLPRPSVPLPVYWAFQTPSHLLAFLHCSWFPLSVLQRKTLISTQIRPTELTLSPRLSPDIYSSRSASIQSIHPPVISLTCCLWLLYDMRVHFGCMHHLKAE